MKRDQPINHSLLTMRQEGQTVIEYTFCMIIILLLIYGAVMALRWAGVSLAERRIAHEQTLGQDVGEKWMYYNESPTKQLSTDFYKISGMNMVFNKW